MAQTFYLHTEGLGFYDRRMQRVPEPGAFPAWTGGSSATDLRAEFVFAAPETDR